MQRKIELEDIKNGCIFSFIDNGWTREGTPTSRRQVLIRKLRQPVSYDSGSEGIKTLKQFRVHSVSEWVFAKDEVVAPPSERDMEFEEKIREPWSEAILKLWHAKKKEFIERSEIRKKYVAEELQRMQGVELAKAMTHFTSMISSRPPEGKIK